MYIAHFQYKPRKIIELCIKNGKRLDVGEYENYVCFLVKTESDNGMWQHLNVFNDEGRIVKFKVPRY